MRVYLKRLIAWAVLLCIVVILVLSAFFICTYAHHDCIGEHCTVCLQINTCLNTVKEIVSALAYFAVCTLMIPAFSCAFFVALKNRYAKDTLIEQRIRLNM